MIRIGQRLKQTRVEKGLTLEDVAQATKIRPSFLTAIERGEYNKLPSSSYALGFVQNYAEFLDLPKKETLALFRREFDEEKVYKVLPEGFVKDDQISGRSFKIQQAVVPVIGILLLLVGFLLYQYRAAFLNPPLSVSSPKEGSIVTSTDVIVTGHTEQNVSLVINNAPVAVENDGKFTKVVTVFPGKSAIVVKAINTFGKESTISRQVEVKSGP